MMVAGGGGGRSQLTIWGCYKPPVDLGQRRKVMKIVEQDSAGSPRDEEKACKRSGQKFINADQQNKLSGCRLVLVVGLLTNFFVTIRTLTITLIIKPTFYKSEILLQRDKFITCGYTGNGTISCGTWAIFQSPL